MIAIGIMSLVGILTAIDAIKDKMAADFSDMGSNTFTIRNRGLNIGRNRHGRKEKSYPEITYDQAVDFYERFDYPGTVSVNSLASIMATVKYKSKKTNPNVRVVGSDPNYLSTSGYSMESGRNFSPGDMLQGSHVVIIGQDIVTMLFENEDPLGKVISIGAAKYKVIGVLAPKGNTMGMSGDNQCLISLTNVRQYYYFDGMSFTVNVKAPAPEAVEGTISEAISLFRIIRKERPGEPNSFEIIRSEAVSEFIIEQIGFISIIAQIIAVITLLGSAIGLMNIMLVSVTERTREIGTRKAVGASAATIRSQFLIEAIVIGQIGGAFGILLGISVGYGITGLVEGVFVIPWNWIIGGTIICLVVGVVSGYYPAQKASKLDPIDSLRYE